MKKDKKKIKKIILISISVILCLISIYLIYKIIEKSNALKYCESNYENYKLTLIKREIEPLFYDKAWYCCNDKDSMFDCMRVK